MKIILCSFIVTLLCGTAFAGDLTSIKGMGMGRVAVATTRGTDAIGVNPANLALLDFGRVQLTLVPTTLDASTQLFTYDMYQKYFTGIDTGGTSNVAKHLTEADKQVIRDQMGSLPVTRVNVESMIAGASVRIPMVGGIGFAMIEHAGMKVALARDYVDLVYLEGLPNNATYNFDGTSFQAWWYREYNVSYGRRVPLEISFLHDLELGIAGKYIQGFGIFQTTKDHASISNTVSSGTNLNTMTADVDFVTRHAGVNFFNGSSGESITPFPQPVGKGAGIDVGLSTSFSNDVRVACSVTDIGAIHWNSNIIETYSSGTINYTGYDQDTKDTVQDILKGKNRAGSSFSTQLPTVLHIGMSTDAENIPVLKYLPGRVLLSFEYAQGFNESLGNTTKGRLSLGAEYRFIPLLVLRSGILMGGDQSTTWAFGVGVDFRYLTFDLASTSSGLLTNRQQAFAAAIGAGMKIRL
jgi:hypothetical protein